MCYQSPSPSPSSSESPALPFSLSPSPSAPSSLPLLSLRLFLFPLPSPCSPCCAGRPPALPPAARRRLAPATSLAGLAAEASLAPCAKTASAFLLTIHENCFLIAVVHPLAPSSAPPGCVRVRVCDLLPRHRHPALPQSKRHRRRRVRAAGAVAGGGDEPHVAQRLRGAGPGARRV
jgi:hypothetical protein